MAVHRIRNTLLINELDIPKVITAASQVDISPHAASAFFAFQLDLNPRSYHSPEMAFGHLCFRNLVRSLFVSSKYSTNYFFCQFRFILLFLQLMIFAGPAS